MLLFGFCKFVARWSFFSFCHSGMFLAEIQARPNSSRIECSPHGTTRCVTHFCVLTTAHAAKFSWAEPLFRGLNLPFSPGEASCRFFECKLDLDLCASKSRRRAARVVE